jgi:hypothetical protein
MKKELWAILCMGVIAILCVLEFSLIFALRGNGSLIGWAGILLIALIGYLATVEILYLYQLNFSSKRRINDGSWGSKTRDGWVTELKGNSFLFALLSSFFTVFFALAIPYERGVWFATQLPAILGYLILAILLCFGIWFLLAELWKLNIAFGLKMLEKELGKEETAEEKRKRELEAYEEIRAHERKRRRTRK